MIRNISKIGGVRIGYGFATGYGASWPFAQLKATQSGITLNIIWKRYYFDKSNILRLKKFKGIGISGLQIIHTEKKYPSFILFWNFNFNTLKAQLEKLGYVFQEFEEGESYEEKSARSIAFVWLIFFFIIAILSITLMLLGD